MRGVAAILLAGVVLLGACGGDDAAPPAAADVTAAASAPLRMVALGDSLTSGGGAPPYTSETCARSDRSWPQGLDAERDDLELVEVRACGGATVAQLLDAWPERGEPAQIPSAPQTDVDVVAFTIGGNDLGLIQLLTYCFTNDCAVPAATLTASLAPALDQLEARLVDEVYPRLRAAYPDARIVHVGYPGLVTTGAVIGCPWMGDVERALLEQAGDELAATIERATRRAEEQGSDVEFLDSTDALAGHQLCTTEPWILPVDGGDPAAAHPTAEGYAAWAAFLADAL